MNTQSEIAEKKQKNIGWIFDLLFIAVLLLGAYFRFSGLDWDEGTYLHPDERFLAMVETSLEPVGSFGEYWDTQSSSMNPNNRGHGFFVYGTLPIFFVRYVMEWVGQVGYGDVAQLGRPLAGVFDLITVFILYLAGSRLYDRRIGFFAAAFSAFSVLQIQLSHFYTVDIFANAFIWLAIYFGARIVRQPAFADDEAELAELNRSEQVLAVLGRALKHPLAISILLFGCITGAAAASKISAFPVAFLLPLAIWTYVSRYPVQRRYTHAAPVVLLMILSGILAALSFRIFQPYAFSGPGFFGVLPNQNWLETIGRLQELVQPSSGYPPSVQWFDRPIWFSFQNLTTWGLGLPLGILAWVSFTWMGYRLIKGDWRKHILVWAWVGLHFLWQSTVPNPTMRYQLPIYPGLGLIAAWGIVSLWDWAGKLGSFRWLRRNLVLLAGVFVFTATLIYAAAFSNIYRTDVTRIAASRWLYQNLPGAINIHIETNDGLLNQPLSFPNEYAIRPGEPYSAAFTAIKSGQLSEVLVRHLDPVEDELNEGSLYLSVLENPADGTQLASALTRVDFSNPESTVFFDFGALVELEGLKTYFLQLDLVGNTGELELCETLDLVIMGQSGPFTIETEPLSDCALSANGSYLVSFTPEENGTLPNVIISQPLNYQSASASQNVTLAIGGGREGDPIASAQVSVTGSTDDLIFSLDEPLNLVEGKSYVFQFVVEDGGPVTIYGSVIAQETSWDDPLPMRVDGYDGFGGIYRGDNNLEIYWDDNPEKIERMVNVLEDVDILPISSSRQWGSLTRLPERWPLVDRYYRLLLGCPDDRSVEWCYNNAEPGMFEGQLGFELVKTFQSNPRLGFIEINDQASEEAFTVYDHPKVFILMKSDDFDSAEVRNIFEDVPIFGSDNSSNEQEEAIKSLLLDDDQLLRQASSGTWSDLFSTESLLNRFQPLTILVWYGAVFLAGLAVYPLLRNLLPGLEDRGYPLARTAGLLVISYTAWVLGSVGLEVSRGLLSIIILGLVVIGGLIALRQREQILREWRLKKKYFLTVETFAAALFLFVLFIRIANPDLWHPWKGGEKPMDFAYFNAVLRSVNFPPYDPWFSGGYINYYYFGYVFVGVLVKWLGIVPAIAYNLIIPTLFMLVGMGAFSITWNLVKTSLRGMDFSPLENIHLQPAVELVAEEEPFRRQPKLNSTTIAYYSALASAAGVALLGNLGTLQMIIQGYQRIAAPPDVVLSEAFFLARWGWTIQGFLKMVTMDFEFPYAMADWYWNPSRTIPAPGEIEPITEFPFFTFLYGDLHAHMIAMPIALLAIGWALSVILAKGKWRHWLGAVASFLLGGIVIGALRPTNTWDFPTYLGFGVLAVFIGGWRSYGGWLIDSFKALPSWVIRLAAGLISAVVLAGLAWFLYQPYTESYALGYSEVNIWEGTHTPLSAYLTHWGLFIFLIVSWMIWETREWLASVPAVKGLRFLRSKLEYILGSLFLIAALISALLYLDVSLSVFVLPLAVWAGVLMLRRDQSEQKRLVLFLVGSGLVLSLMVETIVLSGDIGRMNTVFKFYLQVWLMFGVSAAAIFGWTLAEIRRWNKTWRIIWTSSLVILAFFASLYPLLGGFSKIQDRMAEGSPITLDGLAYMPYANYFEQGKELDLNEDYKAIRWMQENIEGTPVIVEGQVVEYRWGSRYSINTGLPAVLGWNWHQRQQRTGHDLDVWDRANRIQEFYSTTNVNVANRFLADYAVKYIIVGQMEIAYYGGPGVDKFDLFNGQYWQEIYRDGETRIYEVIPQAQPEG